MRLEVSLSPRHLPQLPEQPILQFLKIFISHSARPLQFGIEQWERNLCGHFSLTQSNQPNAPAVGRRN